MLEDETIAFDAHRLRTFLETAIGALFDYLLDHPRPVRIILWEQAEGWQTYTKIISQFDTADVDQLRTLFAQAWRVGLLRSDFDPIIQLVLAEQMCWTYLPPFHCTRYFTRARICPRSRVRPREGVHCWLHRPGMMVDPQETKS